MKAIIRDPGGKLMLRLKVLGCRFCEQTYFADSVHNRKLLKNINHKIHEEIQNGIFDYVMHFPHSANVQKISALQSRFLSPGWRGLPTFKNFYTHQFHHALYMVPKKVVVLVMAYLGELRIDEVSGHYIVRLAEALNTVSGVTKRIIEDCISMVFDVLDRAALCYVFPRPFRFIPEHTEGSDVPLSHQNILQITSQVPAKYREYFLLKFYLGLSTGELMALKWSDYDLSASTFRTQSKDIYVEPYGRRLLFQLMKKTGNFKYIFTDKYGKKKQPNVAWLHKDCWPEACKIAGFPGRGIAALKQASVAYLFEAGVSVNQICHQTGLYYRPVIDQILTKHVLNLRNRYDE